MHCCSKHSRRQIRSHEQCSTPGYEDFALSAERPDCRWTLELEHGLPQVMLFLEFRRISDVHFDLSDPANKICRRNQTQHEIRPAQGDDIFALFSLDLVAELKAEVD